MSRQVNIKALVSHIIRGDGAEKCRICMGDTTDGQVYLGDTVMVEGDRPVPLSELLQVITGVEVMDEALCPQGICTQCTTASIAAYELRTLVNDSNRLWSKAIDLMAGIPSSIPPFAQSICAFIKPDNMTMNVVPNFSQGNVKTNLQNLKHRLSKKKKHERKTRVPRGGFPCKCPDCGKEFLSPYFLNIHLKNSSQKDACLLCGNVFIRGVDMQEHLEKVHGEKHYLCSECPALFSVEESMLKHKKIAHKPGAATCMDCGRTFARYASFEIHSQMHAVRTCRNCGAQFSNRGCYREHRSQCEPGAKPDTRDMPRNKRSNVRDPATFICDYCGKNYASRPQLKNHIIWIHMNVRPHKCQWCGKRFYTAARLTEHIVVHTRERNYECDICGAKLVSKMAAVYHRRRHTGEKPYQCEDCGEKFISASRRSEHAKRRHGKGVRIQCSECPSSFVRRHELKKHFDKAHGLICLEVEVES